MKLIKFDLPINGTKVKNLEELRDNLTDEILTLARSSQLERWLKTRQLPEKAQAVATAVRREGTDKGLFLALCGVLEVEAHPDDVKAIFDVPPAPGETVHDASSSKPKPHSLRKLKLMNGSFKIKNASMMKSVGVLVVGNGLFPGVGNKFIESYLSEKKWIISKVFAKKGILIKNGESIIEFGNKIITYEMPSSVTGVVEEVFVHVGQKAYITQDLISISES